MRNTAALIFLGLAILLMHIDSIQSRSRQSAINAEFSELLVEFAQCQTASQAPLP